MTYVRARTPQEALSQLQAMAEAPDTRNASLPLSVAQAALEAHPWRFASTMADTPHWYTLIRQWDEIELFYGCVATIRCEGEVRYFRRWPYVELDLGGHVYWTMGYPVLDTTLINRRPIE